MYRYIEIAIRYGVIPQWEGRSYRTARIAIRYGHPGGRDDRTALRVSVKATQCSSAEL